MSMYELTNRQLQVYVAVAEQLSFTAAANELHIAQSAASVTIRDVERKLHTRLLERDTRNVVLTSAGQRLLDLSRAVLETQRSAARDFEGFLAGDSGDLVISALPSITALVLPEIISGFTRDNPGVQMHLRDRISNEVVDDLRSGAADIGITSQASVDEDLESRPVLENPLVAVVPAGHHLAQQEVVRWADLAKERLVAIRHGSVQPLMDRAFSTIDAQVTPYAEASSIQSVAGLVAAGLGVSALPRQSVPLIAFSNVETRPLVDPVMTQALCLAWKRSRQLTPAARRLIAHLYASIEHPQPDLPAG